MEKPLFGVFNESVELFGIVVVILLIFVGFIVSLLIKRGLQKIKDLEDVHDDIVAVRLEMAGRQSYTDTIRRHEYEIKELIEAKKDLFDFARRIDARCERRLENAAYPLPDRRIKD